MLDETAFQGVPLTIVGSICRDVKTAPLAPTEHLLRDGETPTEFLVETIGGGGANTAAMAAKLGARAVFAGKVGADELGGRLVAALERSGVRTRVRRDPTVSTGSSIALTYASGQRHFICHQPNNTSLDVTDLDLEAIATSGGHLLRADVWFAEPMLRGGNERLFAAARAAGMTTSLDINWDPLWNVAAREIIEERHAAVRRVLPFVDLAHGNVRELNRFAGSADIGVTLRKITDWGAGAIVLHLGDRGAGFYQRGKLVTVPCVPITQTVNTAGTGDLLSTCVALLHHRTDVPVAEKLQLANRIVAEFMAGRRELLPVL